MKNYVHSGATPALGVLLALIAGSVTALVLGFIYAYAMAWIPLVYLNFLITCGFALGLGVAVSAAAYFGKIRNTFVAYLLGLVAGLLGVYVEWAVSLPALLGWDAGFAFDPRTLLAYGQFLYENGSWGLRGGDAVKGNFLGVIWLIEAGMIVGIATLTAASGIADHPFCEPCNDWTEKDEGVQRLAVLEGQGELVERLASGDLSVLDKFARAPESMSAYLQLDLARCKSCSASCYVTAKMVVESYDKDGDLQKQETPLLRHFTVHESELEHVRNAGRELTKDEQELLFGEPGEPTTDDFLFEKQDAPKDASSAAAKPTEPPLIKE